ncbi:hypothetical protein [Nitrobacter sp. TKz-YC02]|uniref:hypothetical protein n=1 Tax=Nitrobacter sp. TKz-YC02 TaxID=3398704 RepID=UPI003CF4A6D9
MRIALPKASLVTGDVACGPFVLEKEQPLLDQPFGFGLWFIPGQEDLSLWGAKVGRHSDINSDEGVGAPIGRASQSTTLIALKFLVALYT